jgi:hypothetical protein
MHNQTTEGIKPRIIIKETKSITICQFLTALLLETPEINLTKVCPKKKTEIKENSLLVYNKERSSDVNITKKI